MTEQEISERWRLMEVDPHDPEKGKEDETSENYKNFSLKTEKGRQFYRSLNDETLLEILREKAKELGHSPAQAEIFWIWRSYIKKRYGKWPYALEAAGLSKAAGKKGKTLLQMQKEKEDYEELLQELQKVAKRLCRIPHPQEVPELATRLKKYTDDWNKIIRDAGLGRKFFREKASVYPVENLEIELRRALDVVGRLAEHLGRPPLKSEIPEEIRKPLIEKCGSFRNVLFQIGLEPVTRINPFSVTRIQNSGKKERKNHRLTLEDCYYQILHPDEQTKKDLEALYEISRTLKRLPERKEVDAKLRARLQKSCGSWANALNQLKYMKKKKS